MANKKFSEFELKTTTSNVSHIVGYNGAENVRITPANFVTGGGTGVFLPLAGGTMVGNTTHNDNVKSIYGSPGNDLEIFHNGADSFIKDSGTGSLKAVASGFQLLNANETQFMILADGGAGNTYVKLYFNGGEKLATTSTGISVTGDGVFTDNMVLGNNSSTATHTLTIGEGRTGNGFSFIDLVGDATYTDYGLRMLRGNGGENALSIIEHRGTGSFEIKTSEAAPLVFETTNLERMRLDASGNLIVGGTSVGFDNSFSIQSNGLLDQRWAAGTAKSQVLNVIPGFSNGFQTSQDTSNNLTYIFHRGTDNLQLLNLNSSSAGFLVNLGIGTASPQALLDVNKNNSIVYDPTDDSGQRSGTATIHITNQDTTTNTFGQIMYDTDSSGQAIARMVFLDTGTASSAIAFVTEQNNSIDERMRIDSAGDLEIKTGSIKVETAGQGIYLGGTGTANKLDDYEEGDWTPALGGTWTTNPTNLQGRYVKVGSTVTIYLRFTDGDKANATAGYFTGLPFATTYQGTGSVSDSGVNNRGICLFANTDRVWLSGTSFSSTTYAVGTYITND